MTYLVETDYVKIPRFFEDAESKDYFIYKEYFTYMEVYPCIGSFYD